MSAVLQTFRDSLAFIGYGADLIRPDYEYATLNKTRAQESEGVSQIEIAAFSRYPPTYQDACIGVTFCNGLRGRENVLRHQHLGAPLIFEVDSTSKLVRPWSMRSDGPRELKPSFPINRVPEVFARHEHSWGLAAMRALKRGGSNAIQADFFDTLRLPQLDKEFQASLRHLLEGVVEKIQKTYLYKFNRSPSVDYLFPYLFRFLTAKVFLDKQDVDGWTPELSPLDLYRKADAHLAAPRATPIPNDFFDSELMDAVWRAFSGGLRFQNISAAALAYIYESCFIDKATRAQLSIHSTPPELVDLIINQLPIDKLPDSGRKVMEPFCGSGVFLAAAMRRLGELNEHNLSDAGLRHDYFKQRLVGIEFEPLAMEVCQLRLTLSDYPMGNGWNLCLDDVFLWPQWEQELKSTDILLANPPFHEIPVGKRSTYKSTKAVMPAELLHRVMQQPPALLGLVLPPSFLTGPDYREANRAFANAYRRVDYIELPDTVFNYARRETVVVLCSDRRNLAAEAPSNRQVTVTAKQVSKHSLGDFYRSGTALWTRTQVKGFNPGQQSLPLRVDPPADIWEFLNDAPRLNDVIEEIHQGLHWKSRTDGLAKTAPRTDVVSPTLLDGYHPGCEKMKGCLRQFSLCPPLFLSLRPEDQHPADKAWKFAWGKPKVVCNRGRFQPGSPWRLAGFADDKGLAFSQAYLAIWPAADIGLHALAAVLSSPLANAFVADRDVGADTRIATLEILPLPPRASLAPNGRIDSLSHSLHAMFAGTGDYSLHEPDDVLLNETLLRLDAAVLEAYALPVEHERKLLDQFVGRERPVNSDAWKRSEYFKPNSKQSISLRDYLAITLDWPKIEAEHEQLVEAEFQGQITTPQMERLEELQRFADLQADLIAPWPVEQAEAAMQRLKDAGKWTED